MQAFDQFLTVLSDIPDPRRAEGKRYKLPYVLLFSILAVVTGGNSFRAIETFIRMHLQQLNAVFGLHWTRAPGHTAIRYILHALHPHAVEPVFRRHAARLRGAATDPSFRTIALDGKTLRRSFDHFTDRKAAQVLHAFDIEAGMILAHIDIEEKSNEIPAAQQLLDELDVTHCIVTLDALHCQKKTFEAAAQAEAQLLVQLKDNQPTLGQTVQASWASHPSTSTNTTVTTARNRQETRTVDVFDATHAVAGTEWQSLIEDIVRIKRNVLHRNAKTGLWESTFEIAYYVANFSPPAHHAATAIRCHWHIENRLHYTRDVTFQEDQSRIRHNPTLFARIRSFAYNILRRNHTSTFTQARYAAALMGLDALLKWSFS
jgi:predicted transposase YbfD/YdcC